MRPRTLRCLGALLPLAAASLLAPRSARATSVLEYPDNGSEQMGRGGAWLARASDPLAAFYNPAGLAGQETRLTLQSNFALQHTCFTRVQAASDTTIEEAANANGQFPQVCNKSAVAVDPQLGFTYRVNDRIGIGFLPLIAPSAADSSATWPTFVNGDPSPQRYLLLSASQLFITPTLGAGFEVVRGLRLGASFQWGIASFDFKSAVAGVNGPAAACTAGQHCGPDPTTNDLTAELKGHQIFVPGFTLGAIWSPVSRFDLAAWYKWSAPISTSADVTTAANAFSPAVAAGVTRNVVSNDLGDVAQVKLVIPMEAKLGFRYHQPRADIPYEEHKRDPLSQDVWDAEVDLTYANNSAFQNLQIRLPAGPDGEGVEPIKGTPGYAPPIGDVPMHFKDVLGVRAGGDYNVLRDRLAVRAGVFFETKGQDTTYQNINIIGAQKYGIAVGGTYRIHFGGPDKTRALEIMLGLMHVFYADETNNGPSGTEALAGTNCNPVEMPSTNPNCANGNQKFRTNWPVNLGTITSSVNVINAGLSYRF
jgi:long-subunit fatty acid transport protein